MSEGAGPAIEPPRGDAVTRGAAGSSFYTAMRVLPGAQREAMFAIYDFCRAVDDIADGPGERSARVAALDRWRAAVEAMFRDALSARVSRLAEAVRQFGLQREDFLSIVDGVEMDVLGDIMAPAEATLDLYCDRVASAVGRLSVRVFGMERQDGDKLAYHLGRALQLTNILRDLDEDAAKGRLYLPCEALAAARIAPASIEAVLAHRDLDRACGWVAQSAKWHFGHANAIMATQPLRIVRAPILMARAYEMILDRLLARGFAAPRQPVRTSRGALLWSALRVGLLGAR